MRRPSSANADLALDTDRHLGAAVSRAVRAHHRRRLTRVGWLGALDAPAGGWAAGDPPPRPGGLLDVLIDGAEALPRMVAGEPATVIDDYWKPISKEQLARYEAGEPLTHRLVGLAHVSKRSERLLNPLQGLLLDG
jgi:hypothetical protein